jgi:hypothetical protein
MVPYTAIDTSAAFAAAFETAGLPAMRVVVALGALLGIVTGARCAVGCGAKLCSVHVLLPGSCRKREIARERDYADAAAWVKEG